MAANIEDLPVELLADIFGWLTIPEIANVSQVCRRFRDICRDPLLNPWKTVALELIRSECDLSSLKNLSEYGAVPRQLFVDILALAPPHFLLMESTLPALQKSQWEEVLKRRFLPSWRNARYVQPREQFSRILYNVWHRLNTNCTTSQAWCKYIVITRTGHINVGAAYSRTYHPFGVFEELKGQSDLAHLETQVRVILQLADVRILALGLLHRKNSFYINKYSKMLLHPPGVESFISPIQEDEAELEDSSEEAPDTLPELHTVVTRDSVMSSAAAGPSTGRGRSWTTSTGAPFLRSTSSLFRTRSLEDQPVQASPPVTNGMSLLWRLTHVASRSSQSPPPPSAEPTSPQIPTISASPFTTAPSSPASPSPTKSKKGKEVRQAPAASTHPVLKKPQPIPEFENYPNYTPGGADARWKGFGDMEEDGKVWAGPMLITAQITSDRLKTAVHPEILMTHGRFASFDVQDLFAIAPWMKEKITKILDGPGLGI